MASSVSAYLIPPDNVWGVWPLAAPFLTRAANRGGEFIGGWIELLANGKAQLWIAWNGEDCEAAAITELVIRQRGPLCRVIACGGRDMKRWVHVLSDIERWAAAQGCFGMRIGGRKGWARVLPGYAVAGVLLDKELT